MNSRPLRILLLKFLGMVAGTLLVTPASAEPLSLTTVVTPSSVIQKDGKTVVVASHDPRWREYADRVVTICDGVVTEDEEINR